MAGTPGRKHLAGVLRYINTGHPWAIRLISDPKDFTPDFVKNAETDGTDGFLVCATSTVAPALSDSTIPTVLMDFPPPALKRRKTAMTQMFNDDEGIGTIGADYFLGLGNFATYAFVPDLQNRGWSRLRERGFKTELARHGHEVSTYNSRTVPLDAWLKALPKPSAILASHDFRAREVIDACQRMKIPVPAAVSVLGVDNDDIVCEYSKPSLSSININHEKNGYESAAILDRMMRTRKKRGIRRVFMSADHVVERESTCPVPPSEMLIRKANAFISLHFREAITVPDVVHHLGVSRRLAELRFTQKNGKSIRRAIEDCRCEYVKEMLRTSNLSITKISRLAGYPNTQRLKYVFKNRTGMSMSEFRRSSDNLT